MMTIVVRPATLGDVFYLAKNMRGADVAEVMASHGLSPLQALQLSYDASDFAYVGIVDGEIIVMFGVKTLNALYRIGSPWALGTEAISRHYRHFLKGSRWWVSQWRKRYGLLVNRVDDRNLLSKRWLAWLGFTLGPVELVGPQKTMFRSFELRGE